MTRKFDKTVAVVMERMERFPLHLDCGTIKPDTNIMGCLGNELENVYRLLNSNDSVVEIVIGVRIFYNRTNDIEIDSVYYTTVPVDSPLIWKNLVRHIVFGRLSYTSLVKKQIYRDIVFSPGDKARARIRSVQLVVKKKDNDK